MVILLAVSVVPLVPGIVATIQSGLTRLQADALSSGLEGSWATRSDSAIERGGVDREPGRSVAAWLATAVTVTILGSILTFFLLQDGDKAWVWAFQAVGISSRELIMSNGNRALQGVGIWLGDGGTGSVDAVTDFAFLWLLGSRAPSPCRSSPSSPASSRTSAAFCS